MQGGGLEFPLLWALKALFLLPGEAGIITAKRKFGSLALQDEGLQTILGGERITEGDAVIVGAEDDLEHAALRSPVLQDDSQLIVVIAHVAPFAPTVLPSFVA